jgi:hypothetical protein
VYTAKVGHTGRTVGIGTVSKKEMEEAIPGFSSWVSNKYNTDLGRARPEVAKIYSPTHTHEHDIHTT